MEQFKFDKNYNDYWQKRVENSADGSKVAEAAILEKLISKLQIKQSDKVLDAGCGFGRLFPVLSGYSSKTYGIDIDLSMINSASQFGYTSLHAATVENTKFPDSFFDKIIVFAVFDVVEQEEGLIEINRILKDGGKCLITGKNIEYREDDAAAFIAEKNAAAKNFPNHFTDLSKLILNIDKFGFSVHNILIAERRGDFGNDKLQEIRKDILENAPKFYEYCIVLEKNSSITEDDVRGYKICDKTSNTYKKLTSCQY